MTPSSAYYRRPHPTFSYYEYEPIGVAPSTQAPPLTVAEQQASLVEDVSHGVVSGILRVTPTLILVAIATGASFAIGSYLAHRYILPAGAGKTSGGSIFPVK
jgi:hypothetical protein